MGVDYISGAPCGASTLTHVILLQAGVILVEGLNLSAMQLGRYELICLPLELGGCRGISTHAMLVSDLAPSGVMGLCG